MAKTKSHAKLLVAKRKTQTESSTYSLNIRTFPRSTPSLLTVDHLSAKNFGI